MGVYTVLLDGTSIYDLEYEEKILYNSVVKTEVGAAGSFEFTMTNNHFAYDVIIPYGSSIEVLEDGNSIFFGRPLKPKIGFYNQKTYHCEGALAFLNDTRPADAVSYEDTTPIKYFRDLIAYHNSLQSKASRRFTVGNITVRVDRHVYREMTPSMTIMEHIKRGCVGSDGGYLFTRRVNGVTYIDWVKNMPYTCNQTVEFALNLLDMSRSGNDDIYTGVILKGGERRIKKNGKTSNSVVQYGPVWGSAEAIAKYGEIIGYQEYPDITDIDELIEAGDYFLSSQQFESMVFEVSTAERHYLNVSLDVFKAGQMVHLVSNPHFVDMMLPVQSVEVRLDSAEKKVTLGTLRRQTLTKIQRKTRDDVDDISGEFDDLFTAVDEVNNWIADPIFSGDDGYDYRYCIDPVNNNVYAVKTYKNIYIKELPYKVWYEKTETYDWTGLVVIGIKYDGTEIDITSECTVDPANGDTCDLDDGKYPVAVTWTDTSGKSFTDSFEITVGVLIGSVLEIKMSGIGHYHYDVSFLHEEEDTFECTIRMHCGPETRYVHKIAHPTRTSPEKYSGDVYMGVYIDRHTQYRDYVDNYGYFSSISGSSIRTGERNGIPINETRSWSDSITANSRASSASVPVLVRFADFFNEQMSKGNYYANASGRPNGIPRWLSNSCEDEDYPQTGGMYYSMKSCNENTTFIPNETGAGVNYSTVIGFSGSIYYRNTAENPTVWWEFHSRITSVRIIEP